jgi:hypothetical protein
MPAVPRTLNNLSEALELYQVIDGVLLNLQGFEPYYRFCDRGNGHAGVRRPVRCM